MRGHTRGHSATMAVARFLVSFSILTLTQRPPFGVEMNSSTKDARSPSEPDSRSPCS